jgi:hypothetical protein
MPRPPRCLCGGCQTCKARERSRQLRLDPEVREDLRRRSRERWRRLRANREEYAEVLREARERQREKRRNGFGPVLREQDRRRYWSPRCPGPGLTLSELAKSTSVEIELLADVLAQESSGKSRRVWLDSDGTYRLVVDRFDAATLRALGELDSA